MDAPHFENESAVLPDSAQEPVRLNLPRRLFGIMFRSRETFLDIDRRPDWFLPLMLTTALALIGNLLATDNIRRNPQEIAQGAIEREIKKSGRSLSDLSDKERQAYERQASLVAILLRVLFLISTLMVPATIALMALFYWIIITLMKATTTFQKVFSVTTYSLGVICFGIPALLRIADDLLNKAGVVARLPPFDLGVIAPEGTSPVLSTFLSSFDIFTVWSLFVISLGLTIVSQKARKARITGIVFGLWGVWIALCVLRVAIFRR